MDVPVAWTMNVFAAFRINTAVVARLMSGRIFRFSGLVEVMKIVCCGARMAEPPPDDGQCFVR